MPLQRTRPEDRSLTWSAPMHVRLYLDQVDQILAAMKQLGPVRAVLPDFEGVIESGEELKTTGLERIRYLTLESGEVTGHLIGPDKVVDNAVRVRIEPGKRPSLVVGRSDDPLLVGVMEQMKSAVARGRTLLPWTTVGIFALLTLVVIGVGFLLITAGGIEARSAESRILSSVGGVMTALVMMASLRVTLPQSYVLVSYRADAPTWWERNSTAVIVNLVTNAIVGLLFFWLGQVVD
jgi:hypothetical protein